MTSSSIARSTRLRRLAPAVLIAAVAFGAAAGVSMEAAGVASAKMTETQIWVMCTNLGGDYLPAGSSGPAESACCWHAEDTGKTHCNYYLDGELVGQDRKAATGLDPAVPVTSAPRPPLHQVPSDISTVTLAPASAS